MISQSTRAGPGAFRWMIARTNSRISSQQKQELDALYTPDHPDVVAISRKIADLQAEIAHAPAEPAPARRPPVNRPDSPQLQQLKAQLRAAQQSMAVAKQEQARIRAADSHL